MNKLEEKFKNIVPSYFGGLDPELIKQCVEIAEAFAIKFSEYLAINYLQSTDKIGFWYKDSINDQSSTKQILSLYKQQLKDNENR